MKDRTIWFLLLTALVLGFGYSFLLWCLFGAPLSKPLAVQWAAMYPPTQSYISYIPCVRTWGAVLPFVECFPTESRSVGLTLHDEPEPPAVRRG